MARMTYRKIGIRFIFYFNQTMLKKLIVGQFWFKGFFIIYCFERKVIHIFRRNNHVSDVK